MKSKAGHCGITAAAAYGGVNVWAPIAGVLTLANPFSKQKLKLKHYFLQIEQQVLFWTATHVCFLTSRESHKRTSLFLKYIQLNSNQLQNNKPKPLNLNRLNGKTF